jgi:hypothetical protein
MDDEREARGHTSRPMSVKEDVRFASGPVSLAGTVLAPAGAGPHPAVVLVHDAGAREAHELRPLAKALACEGIGTLIYNAATSKDFPMLEAGVLVIGALYMVATLLADVLFTLLNPRLRYRAAE